MKSFEIIKNNKKRKILLLNDEEKEIRKQAKDKIAEYNITAPNVYSFTKGKSSKMAVEKIKNNIKYYNYYIKIDIKDYYSSIDVNKLNDILKLHISDTYFIDKIIKLVNEERNVMDIKGLSVGSPLSNILSNIYLNEIDQKYLNFDGIYVRFCDDIFMLSDNKENFNDLKSMIIDLGLVINKNKTVIGNVCEKVKFLGFNICSNGEKQLTEAQKYIHKIYDNGNAYEDIIDELIENRKYSVIEEINKYKLMYDNADTLVNKLLKLFSIRERGYYISKVNGIKDYKYQDKILDASILRKHLKGEISVAVSLAREDDKSNIAVLDFDNVNINFNKIENGLRDNKLSFYKEFSGMKGYHYWLFFDRFYNIKDINKIINEIKEKYFADIKVEIIPKDDFISETESVIKLPYGIHPVNKNKSYFIGNDLEKHVYYNTLRASEEEFNKFLIDFNNRFKEGEKLLNNCSVTKQIIKDGIIEKAMCHYKRLILLYVLKFLDNGEEMLHFIFENMNNYSFNITERNINKSFSNPICCEKIRSYIKDESDRIRCSCDTNISCPIMKVNQDKYSGILYKEEMKKIIEKIIKLKNERKSIDRNITILENKLEKIFDLSGGKEANVEIGKLKRKDDKWVIEMEI